MSIRYIVLPMLLAAVLAAGTSMAQSEPNNTSTADLETGVAPLEGDLLSKELDSSALDSAAAPAPNANNTSEKAVALEEPKTSPENADLKSIWRIVGLEQNQIIMSLNQEGADLFGAAKYEEGAAPWNGAVIGKVFGDRVDIVITALKGKEQVSTWLNGTFSGEAISGKFFEVSSGNISRRGEFNVTWISSTLSDYIPAKVAQPLPEEATSAVAEESTQQAGNQSTQQPIKLGGGRQFEDIHKYADKVLTGVGDLSGGLTGYSFPS